MMKRLHYLFAFLFLATITTTTAQWVPIDSPTFESQGIVIQVGFSKDGVHGYAGGGTPSGGGQVIKTDDSGKTWKQIFPKNQSKFDLNLFLTTQVKDEKHAIMAGAFYNAFTEDGEKVNVAIDFFHSPSQGSGIIPGKNEFVIISGKETSVGGNSLGISKTGYDYTKFPIPDSVLNSTDFLARYGAFPSEDVWYITAGTFPSASDEKTIPLKKDVKIFNKHIHVDANRMSINWAKNNDDEEDHTKKSKTGGGNDIKNDSGYSAGIIKTTDGGKTWTVVYKNFNTGDNIYPNGIDCFTEKHCIAVLEGESARIIVTRDGGATWKQTLMDNDPHSSLMDVKMLSDTEAWAAGGHPESGDFEGRFFHSLDGGNTWTKESIKGIYIVSLDMLTTKSGYAVSLTQSQPAGIKLFKYTPSKK